MESQIKEYFNASTLKDTGEMGGGCINDGKVFEIDDGSKVYVKINKTEKAFDMFSGESKSLLEIASTGAVRVPKPYTVLRDQKGGAFLIMEYLDMSGLRKKASDLGERLARMHLHNIELESKLESTSSFVNSEEKKPQFIQQFGFDVPTHCGSISQDNTWTSDWQVFYARKLQDQINLVEKQYGDRVALDSWSELSRCMGDFFRGIVVKPSLLHGDLWGGNAAEMSTEPVIFDPASFYGHHEYDLAIADMFGGFGRGFWDSYHRLIPKANGWDQRHNLYILFHYLNHWNHFGSGYRSQSLRLMKELIKVRI